MLAGAVGLLERIGPSVLLTRALGGGFGWLALSECPSLVKAAVAVEPAGPPLVTMMLERNNAEVAALMTDWIVKHT
jgi:hypothetical protein